MPNKNDTVQEIALDDLMKFLLPEFEPTLKLADPSLVLFYKNLQNRDLWLDTEITWGNCSFLVQYIQHLNNYEMENPNPAPIYLHIMSNGGELPTMFALYNVVKNSRIPVITINESACHSAAFIVFLAGKERRMNPDGVFCAHEGSGGVGGTYRESKAAMANYEKDVARMREIIAQETNLSTEEVEQHFSQESDWYIRYDEAVKLGVLK